MSPGFLGARPFLGRGRAEPEGLLLKPSEDSLAAAEAEDTGDMPCQAAEVEEIEEVEEVDEAEDEDDEQYSVILDDDDILCEEEGDQDGLDATLESEAIGGLEPLGEAPPNLERIAALLEAAELRESVGQDGAEEVEAEDQEVAQEAEDTYPDGYGPLDDPPAELGFWDDVMDVSASQSLTDDRIAMSFQEAETAELEGPSGVDDMQGLALDAEEVELAEPPLAAPLRQRLVTSAAVAGARPDSDHEMRKRYFELLEHAAEQRRALEETQSEIRMLEAKLGLDADHATALSGIDLKGDASFQDAMNRAGFPGRARERKGRPRHNMFGVSHPLAEPPEKRPCTVVGNSASVSLLGAVCKKAPQPPRSRAVLAADFPVGDEHEEIAIGDIPI